MDREIVEFLLRAKRASYAGNGERAEPSETGANTFRYREGETEYMDTYLGSFKFSGRETLRKDNLPFWVMNYVGRTVADGFSSDFLKDALSRGTDEYPYRGPLEYTSGEYSYTCSARGDFHWFYGYEVIFYRGNKAYECAFHGGDIE